MTCSSEIMDIWSFISVPHICLHARNGAEVYSSVFLFIWVVLLVTMESL